MAAYLGEVGYLAATIHLEKVSHFTTFHKAAQRRHLDRHVQQYFDKTIHLAHAQRRLPRHITPTALDRTDFESRHVSHYYVKNRVAIPSDWQRITAMPANNTACVH